MTGWNLPPGCSESDLPGWHDVEEDIEFECELGHIWIETDVTVDDRGGHDVEAKCPECGEEVTKYFKREERD